MRDRGTYGPLVGADVYYVQPKSSSWGTWIVGGLVVGGAVLWARHQSDQIGKLYATAGLPHESFTDNLRQRSRELSSAAGEKLHALSQRFRAKKGP